jgi:hypothetical protein
MALAGCTRQVLDILKRTCGNSKITSIERKIRMYLPIFNKKSTYMIGFRKD